MNKSDIVNIATQHVPESELPCRIELWGSDNNKVFGSGTTWGSALERAVRFVEGLLPADDWTYITDALPPNNTRLIASCKGGEVSDVQYTGGRFLYTDDNREVHGVYAYQLWPEAAPYREPAP